MNKSKLQDGVGSFMGVGPRLNGCKTTQDQFWDTKPYTKITFIGNPT